MGVGSRRAEEHRLLRFGTTRTAQGKSSIVHEAEGSDERASVKSGLKKALAIIHRLSEQHSIPSAHERACRVVGLILQLVVPHRTLGVIHSHPASIKWGEQVGRPAGSPSVHFLDVEHKGQPQLPWDEASRLDQ
jgi:hypothetical protein